MDLRTVIQRQAASALAMSDVNPEEHRMSHQPSEDGPPIHNLLKSPEGSEWSAPDDIYTHMHYYADPHERSDQESMDAIHRARHDRPLSRRPATEAKDYPLADVHIPARPEETDEHLEQRRQRRSNGDHLVTVYRSAPKGVKVFNPGDWVTPSKSYARQHGLHATDKEQDWPVYKAKVPAKHVRWAGDSVNEFGYFGPSTKAEVHFRGGRSAERVNTIPSA